MYERNRGAGTMTRLGNNPREISLDTPVGVLDSSTGKQVMVTKKDIIGNPGRYAPTSADVSTPVIKQTLKEYASTKPNTAGGQVIAFNTAILTSVYLSDAADALGNGNTKAVQLPFLRSGRANRFAPSGQLRHCQANGIGRDSRKWLAVCRKASKKRSKVHSTKSNSPQALKGSIGA